MTTKRKPKQRRRPRIASTWSAVQEAIRRGSTVHLWIHSTDETPRTGSGRRLVYAKAAYPRSKGKAFRTVKVYGANLTYPADATPYPDRVSLRTLEKVFQPPFKGVS